MNTARNILLTAVALTIAGWGAIASAGGNSSSDWRSKQEIWWNDADLVGHAISAFYRYKGATPELQFSKQNPTWEIGSLLLVLDRKSDQKTLDVLAGLTSYYLGESINPVFECVVRRKGAKIDRALAILQKSGHNACSAALGPNNAGCLTPDAHKQRLDFLRGAIKEEQPCYIEP